MRRLHGLVRVQLHEASLAIGSECRLTAIICMLASARSCNEQCHRYTRGTSVCGRQSEHGDMNLSATAPWDSQAVPDGAVLHTSCRRAARRLSLCGTGSCMLKEVSYKTLFRSPKTHAPACVAPLPTADRAHGTLGMTSAICPFSRNPICRQSLLDVVQYGRTCAYVDWSYRRGHTYQLDSAPAWNHVAIPRSS